MLEVLFVVLSLHNRVVHGSTLDADNSHNVAVFLEQLLSAAEQSVDLAVIGVHLGRTCTVLLGFVPVFAHDLVVFAFTAPEVYIVIGNDIAAHDDNDYRAEEKQLSYALKHAVTLLREQTAQTLFKALFLLFLLLFWNFRLFRHCFRSICRFIIRLVHLEQLCVLSISVYRSFFHALWRSLVADDRYLSVHRFFRSSFGSTLVHTAYYVLCFDRSLRSVGSVVLTVEFTQDIIYVQRSLTDRLGCKSAFRCRSFSRGHISESCKSRKSCVFRAVRLFLRSRADRLLYRIYPLCTALSLSVGHFIEIIAHLTEISSVSILSIVSNA